MYEEHTYTLSQVIHQRQHCLGGLGIAPCLYQVYVEASRKVIGTEMFVVQLCLLTLPLAHALLSILSYLFPCFVYSFLHHIEHFPRLTILGQRGR